MEPSDIQELLEEILRVSREKFKYDDYRETNEKFPQLSKYLFKWTTGNACVTGEQTKTKVDSQGNMKKLANAIEAGPSHAAVFAAASGSLASSPSRQSCTSPRLPGRPASAGGRSSSHQPGT